MAGYGGQLVALNVETPTEIQSDLANASLATSKSQLAAQTLPSEVSLAQSRASLGASEAGKSALDLTEANESHPLRQAAIARTLIANAASAVDPNDPDAATKWDEALKKAAAAGAGDQALQLVGHYSPQLQGRVTSAFSASTPQSALAALGDQTGIAGSQSQLAGAPAQGGRTDPQTLYANMPLAQQKQMLAHFDVLRAAIDRVQNSSNPQATFDQEAQNLGVPQYKGTNWLQEIQTLAPEIVQHDIYLRQAISAQDAGIPLAKPQGEVKEVGGVLYRMNRDGTVTQLTQPTSKYQAIPGSMDDNMRPYILDTTTGKLTSGDAGTAGGTQAFPMASYIDRTVGAESGGAANARNPKSSATGAGQFVDATWLRLMKANHSDLTAGKSDAQIIAMKTDPKLSREMVGDYANENAAALTSAGEPINPATLGMAHAVGPANAIQVLGSTPDTPMSSILSPRELKANPQWASMTAGQFATSIAGRYSGMGGTAGGTVASTMGGAQTGGASGGIGSDVHGADYLKTLPPNIATQVQALADGRMQFPSGFALTKPFWQKMIGLVAQYDPTFNQSDYNARAKTRAAFTSGQEGRNITSYNTAIGHLEQMDHAIDALGNTPFSWWNAPAQRIGQLTGDMHTQAAIANFNTVKGAVTSEMVKSLRGSGGAEADIQYWMKRFDQADSPAALHAAVKEAASLLGSRIDALTDQYNTGMGTSNKTIPGLSPHSASALARLQGLPQQVADAGTSAAPAPAGTVGFGPNGHTPIFTRDQALAASKNPANSGHQFYLQGSDVIQSFH
jgi:hypothetical protein